MLRRRAWLFIAMVFPLLLLMFLWQLLLWRMSLHAPLWQLQLPGDIVEIEADGQGGFIVLQQVGGQGGSAVQVALTRLDAGGAIQWSNPDASMLIDSNPRMKVSDGKIRISGELGLQFDYDLQGNAAGRDSATLLRDARGVDSVFAATPLPDGGSLQFCRLVNDSDNSIAARLGLELPGHAHQLLQLGRDSLPLAAVDCAAPLVGGIWQADTGLYALIEYYGDPWLGDHGNSRTVSLFSLGGPEGLHAAGSTDMPGYISSVLNCQEGLAVLGGDLLIVNSAGLQTVASDPQVFSIGNAGNGGLLASRASSLPLRGWLRKVAYGPEPMEACRLEQGRLRRMFSFRAVLPRSLRSCLAESSGLVLVGESDASHAPLTTLNCYRP
ncbi:hypothetical protein KDL44_04470 [bacterium]|nr:hypothetical protein [bacterium]